MNTSSPLNFSRKSNYPIYAGKHFIAIPPPPPPPPHKPIKSHNALCPLNFPPLVISAIDTIT